MTRHLIVHAGLRPGELFLQHADEGSEAMIIVPPAQSISRFAVEASDGHFWLTRLQQGRQSEPLIAFKRQDDADQALIELTDSLMLAAPSEAGFETAAAGKASNDKPWLLISAGTIFLAGVIALAVYMTGNRTVAQPALQAPSIATPSAHTLPEAVAPAADNGPPAQVPFSPAIPGGMDSAGLNVAPWENAASTPIAAPTAAAAPAPAMDPAQTDSPGDAFARKVNGR